MIKAVLWDFGGVLTTGPFHAFNRYEREHGIPKDFIRTVNATNPDSNAWARFENNQISLLDFDKAFAEETRAQGHEIPGRDVLQLIGGDIRPEMVEALRRISSRYRTACLTNNFRPSQGAAPERAVSATTRASAVGEIMGMFDTIVESSVVGFRKPDPRFYQLACEKLQIVPDEGVFLDDLGINLKPAREMGMHTIKVTDDIDSVLDKLESLLDMSLR